MTKQYAFFLQCLFMGFALFGSNSVERESYQQFLILIARCIVYISSLKILLHRSLTEKALTINNIFDLKVFVEYRKLIQISVGSLVYLVFSKEKIVDIYFFPITCAGFVIEYFVMEQKPISYGVGMACSFFEGYLNQVIPSDGGELKGFQDNIQIFESRNRVVFPVKRLFLIITKSLHCPPDLKSFNKDNRPEIPYLEACSSLEDVVKDVAGVKKRSYKNSTYRINRPNDQHHVYVAAECATPLHTLYKVLKNRDLYEKIATINVKEVVDDFTKTLKTIIDNSPECKGKIELVEFDDEDESLNLADILLERIHKIEPNFESYLESMYKLLAV